MDTLHDVDQDADDRACLEVRSPAGEVVGRFPLDAPRATIGRHSRPQEAEIALPDPDRVVSRLHCVIEREGGAWHVADAGSRNGTFVRRDGVLRRVQAPTELVPGDVVCIVAGVGDADESHYWELALADPLATREARAAAAEEERRIIFDPRDANLYLHDASGARPISLTKLEHRLVRHMAARNAEVGSPALCYYNELIEAVWQNPALRTHVALNGLVWTLRRKLRAYVDQPLIENERALGYRLRI